LKIRTRIGESLRHIAAFELGKNASGEGLHVAPTFRNSTLRVATSQGYGKRDRNEYEKRTQY
jgi:hypothetical protein